MNKTQMKSHAINKSVLFICITCLLLCSIYEPSFASISYNKNFDAAVLPAIPASGANEWQIIRGGYIGNYDGSDVSKNFDNKANVSYSNDNAVRLTKNVISTDTENEFLMYLCIEPQVSWEDILQLNTIMVTNANKNVKPPEWPSAAGHPSFLKPEKNGNYTVPVQIEYYAVENGKRITLAKVIMYADTQEVPKGAYGIGNPLLEPSGGTFSADNNFNLKPTGNSGISTAEIDISSIYKKYDFATQKVYPQELKDQTGNHILLDINSLNYDGGTCTYQNGIVNWTLPQDDPGLLPYVIDTDGKVTPSGVLRSLENGKATYYRERAYQMSYKFTLTVNDDNFISCGTAQGTDDISAEYAVQTNISPDSPSNKEYGGTVTYKTSGITGTGHLKSPYIKGLLYNLEFQKVIEGSDIPLEGVVFKIERKSTGNSHSEEIKFSDIKTTGSDGWIKFHNMPWGEYVITETAYQDNNKLQNDYLEQELPREIATVKVGQVINGDALTSDHDSLHHCDESDDTRNQLFILQNGKVTNTPYRAKLTIKKEVRHYDNLSAELKNTSYVMKTDSDNCYIKPEENHSKLHFLDENDSIAHQETLTYDLIVPKSGGKVNLEEIIPNQIKGNIVFDNISLTVNSGSTSAGSFELKNSGCSMEILPGNDITLTVTNIPVGKVCIKTVTDNYRSELAGDSSIVEAISAKDTDEKINTQTVLQHNETSSVIRITEPTTLDISETLPKEYSFSGITLKGGGQLSDTSVTVNPGEEVTITVHNSYTGKPFFHVSDAVSNIFKHAK